MVISRILFALLAALALSGCDGFQPSPGPAPAPTACKGKECLTFFTENQPKCVSPLEPNAVGLYARATASGSFTYPNGVVTLFFQIEKRRADLTVIGTTPVQKRIPNPGDETLLSCDTTREIVDGVPNSKVLNFVQPLCATSEAVAPDLPDCTSRPIDEAFPPDYRYPPLSSLRVVLAAPPPIDCKLHCKFGSETPLCKILAVPASLTRVALAAGIDWHQVLRDLLGELLDETKFPISPKRQEQILRIKPSDYGRTGDIFLLNSSMGQDGIAGPLPFVFDDNGTQINLDIEVGEIIIGKRSIIGADSLEWLPDPNSKVPTLKFQDSAWNVVFGGPMTQMQLTPQQLVAGNQSHCVAIRY